MANSLRSNADGTMSVLNGSGTEVANFPSTAPQQVNIGAKGITLGTALTASGTYIDFTGIPSWAKRITVMFYGVSTNGVSSVQVQLGSGSIQTTGYVYSACVMTNAGASVGAQYTTGFGISGGGPSSSRSGICSIINTSTNLYIASMVGSFTDVGSGISGGGYVTISGTLDRIRITTVNGTDTFDAGTINIMYEG